MRLGTDSSMVYAAEGSEGDAAIADAPAPAAQSPTERSEAASGEGASPTPTAAEATPAPAAAPVKDPQIAWRDRRIAELSQKLKAARASAGAGPQPPAAPAAGDTVPLTEVERLANERAQEIAAREQFNSRCNAAAQEGAKLFPDFSERVGNLISLRDEGDPASVMAYTQLLTAALETGKAPEVLHRLGGDMEQAQKLMGLPPIKMALEVAKLAMPVAEEAAAPSAAPKPIRPVGMKGDSATRIAPDDKERADTLTTEEWMRQREAQLKARV